MSRFLALSLMTATAAVLAGFVPPDGLGAELPWLNLALPLVVIGLLFGLLASEHHVVWSLLTAGIVISMLWRTPAPDPAFPTPTGSPVARVGAGPWLVLPPASLLAGSLCGAYFIRRRHRKITQPETSD